MIRSAVQYRHGTVKLLHEDKPYHLMRKGHARKRQFLVCRCINFGGETVRSADNKNQPFVYGIHLALHIVRDLYGAHCFSPLVQQHHYITRLESFQDEFALFLFSTSMERLLVFFNSGMTSISNER